MLLQLTGSSVNGAEKLSKETLAMCKWPEGSLGRRGGGKGANRGDGRGCRGCRGRPGSCGCSGCRGCRGGKGVQ